MKFLALLIMTSWLGFLRVVRVVWCRLGESDVVCVNIDLVTVVVGMFRPRVLRMA